LGNISDESWSNPFVIDLATDSSPTATDSLAQYPLSDAGNAEAFVEMFGDLVRYDHARNRWLVWTSTAGAPTTTPPRSAWR
jgi:hypothetical protein